METSILRLVRFLLLLTALIGLAGCQSVRTKPLFGGMFAPKPLRVGVVTDAPPLAYAKNGEFVGLEAEFAAGLARAVNRKLILVAMERSELAKALLEDKIDIVMAAMTVAEAQADKLAATDPYLLSGQTALVHLDDFQRLGASASQIGAADVRLGVVSGSPGEELVGNLKAKGSVSRFNTAADAVQALISDRIDAFLFDQPANAYYASQYLDKGLTPGVVFLARQEFAWAVRPKDEKLRQAANAYLNALATDKELDKMLERTIPFYRNTIYSPKQ